MTESLKIRVSWIEYRDDIQGACTSSIIIIIYFWNVFLIQAQLGLDVCPDMKPLHKSLNTARMYKKFNVKNYSIFIITIYINFFHAKLGLEICQTLSFVHVSMFIAHSRSIPNQSGAGSKNGSSDLVQHPSQHETSWLATHMNFHPRASI